MWPNEVVFEIAMHLFARSGSIRKVCWMAMTCRAWREVVKRDVVRAIVRMRKWQRRGVQCQSVLKARFTPLLRWDSVLTMQDEPIASLHIDKHNRLFLQSPDAGLLWTGSTSSWILRVFRGERGVRVLDKSNFEEQRVILDESDVCFEAAGGADGWLYKLGASGVVRVLLLSDADVAAASQWECVMGPGVVHRLVGAGSQVLGITAGGTALSLRPSTKGEWCWQDVEQCVECNGVWVRRLTSGAVVCDDRELVHAGCYMMCAQDAFLALALYDNSGAYYCLEVWDLISGWKRRVRTRGFFHDMTWTPTGNVAALCRKMVFLVGGPAIKA